MLDIIENIACTEVADGWLVLDYNRETDLFHLSLEYGDGEVLELKSYKKEVIARKKFNEEAEKLQ